MKFFLLPVEICSRELEYKYNLALDLVKNHNNKALICRPWVAQKIGIIFKKINWIGQNLFENGKLFKNQVIDYLHENDSKVFYFDEEGGVYPKETAYKIFSERYAKKNLCAEDIIFAWGEEQFKILQSKNLTAFKIGHPRFINKDLFSGIEGKDILIMTNFSLAFSSMSFEDRYFNKKIYKSRQSAMLKDIANLFNIISELDSSLNIHIRPHPSEDIVLYKMLFRNYKNIIIRHNETLDESFNYSTKLYHFDCTTALDAYCKGIESINLGTNPVTIISDIEKDSLVSEWLEYPCNIEQILDLIASHSIDSSMNKIKLNILIISAHILELTYHIKQIFIKTNYEKNKFGDFFLSKGLFKIKVL